MCFLLQNTISSHVKNKFSRSVVRQDLTHYVWHLSVLHHEPNLRFRVESKPVDTEHNNSKYYSVGESHHIFVAIHH